MKIKRLLHFIFLISAHSYAQQKTDNRKEIIAIINNYSKTVIKKDSTAFYSLFNDGAVTWCAAIKDRSQAKEFGKNGIESAPRNYFSGSYQAFTRSLLRYTSTEDKKLIIPSNGF